MIEARRTRHIDAALDRMNPGRARIRHHDAGGAQDRQAAHNTEPRVERLGGKPLPVRDPDLDFDVARSATGRGNLRNGVANHPPRYRIDGRLARRNRKARPGDGADAGSGAERDAAAGRGGANRREHERAMRHVGIVTGVLDDAGGGGVRILSGNRESERHPVAARQRHLDWIGKFTRQQRRIGGLYGCGGAGAGGPTPAKRAVFLAHCVAYSAPARSRHDRTCRS